MKVKITHTVDYEELPAIISTMVADCRNSLKRASMFKFNMHDLEKTAAEITHVQNDIDLISSKLEDCLNISVGYEHAQDSLTNTTRDSEIQEDVNENNN